MLINLIPKVFYNHLQDGLDLFVSGLGFKVLHQDDDLAVVARDGAKAYLVESPEFAAKDRPEIAIETDTIDALFAEISFRAPHLLHRNGATITLKPWGAREFGVLDKTDVCVIFRQWPEQRSNSAMPDEQPKFESTSLAGARFHDVNLRSSSFDDVALADASFSNVSFKGAKFANIDFRNVEISNANLAGMTINGILVTDLLHGRAP
ncbi:pentapeptide repeat-containing protein [Solilutibacter silvestris]|uniref:pentapeptide repeat-containing protein n=1 Tax=Solilutibacter silvestris TaxID=1645665 RepID=UPI003D32F016